MAHPLTEARRRAGLSQQGLANAVECDRLTITRIESGKYRTSLETAEKIMNALRAKNVELSASAFFPAMETAP
jgi:DNA-binding XRE family transcriptional regulator